MEPNTIADQFDLKNEIKLHDIFIDLELTDAPTEQQLRVALLLLPPEILLDALAHGFDDSDVADRIYRYVDGHREQFKGIFQ